MEIRATGWTRVRMKLFNSLLKGNLSKHLVPLASVTGATAINNLAAFAVHLWAARALGVAGFGVFSLAFSVATLTGTIGDLGLNLTMIRLFNKYKDAPETQTKLFGSVFGFKVLLFVLLVLISLPLGRFLALSLGVGLRESGLFAIALITGGLLFFWTYLQSYLQSHRSFTQLTGYIIAYAGLRLGCLAVGYALFPQSPLTWLVATYTGPLLLLFIVGVLPKARKPLVNALAHPRESLALLKEGLNYSKWVALSGIAYIAMPYVVRFVLATRASINDVGIFSAGMTFTMAFTTLNTAVRAVLFPRVTALEGSERMREYLRKLGRFAPYYAGVAILGISVLGFLQWFVLGEEYRTAMPVFLITAGVFAIVVFLGLGTMLIHTMMRPQVEAVANLSKLSLVLILSLLLVPSLRALGGAIAYAVPLVAGEAGMLWYVSRNASQK